MLQYREENGYSVQPEPLPGLTESGRYKPKTQQGKAITRSGDRGESVMRIAKTPLAFF